MKRYIYKSRWKKVLAYLFDLAGNALFFFHRLSARRFRPEEVRRILIVRLDQIGDVVMTRPAAALLRAHFPLASIDWLVSAEAAPLLAGDTRVADAVIPMQATWFTKGAGAGKVLRAFREVRGKLRAARYDFALDFRGDLRHILFLVSLGIRWRAGYPVTGGGFLLTHTRPLDFAQHQVDANCSLLKTIGLYTTPVIPPFHYPENTENQVLQKLQGLAKGKRIVIQTGAGYESKRWPQERFQELIGRIISEKLGEVILIGTKSESALLKLDDKFRPKIRDLRGETSIDELPALFDRSDVFIGNDSGPSHIAAAQGIPVICLFSAVNPAAVWKPRGREVHTLFREIECSPCYSRTCLFDHHKCMKDISVDEVMRVLKYCLAKEAWHAEI